MKDAEISLLDFFAAAALAGLMASDDPGEVNAARCFAIAERMVEESAKAKAKAGVARKLEAYTKAQIATDAAAMRAVPYATPIRFDDEGSK